MKFARMVVGMDGSPLSRQALIKALELAAADTRIVVVSVEESLPQYVALRGEVDENRLAADEYFARLDREAAELARQYGRSVEFQILRGHAAKVLVEFARDESADLIVIGQSGHSGVWGTFLGTTADKVVRHAPCSVLVVRPAGGATNVES